MKKTFEQPTFEVVRMNNSDIVTLSIQVAGSFSDENYVGAADRFRDFEDYSY